MVPSIGIKLATGIVLTVAGIGIGIDQSRFLVTVPDIAPTVWLDADCPVSHTRQVNVDIDSDLSAKLSVRVVPRDYHYDLSTWSEEARREIVGDPPIDESNLLSLGTGRTAPHISCQAIGVAIYPPVDDEPTNDGIPTYKVIMSSTPITEVFQDTIDEATNLGGTGALLVPKELYKVGNFSEPPPAIPFLFEEIDVSDWIKDLGNGRFFLEIRNRVEADPLNKTCENPECDNSCENPECTSYTMAPGTVRITYPQRLRLTSVDPYIERDGRNVLRFRDYNSTVRAEFFDPNLKAQDQIVLYLGGALLGLGLGLVFDSLLRSRPTAKSSFAKIEESTADDQAAPPKQAGHPRTEPVVNRSSQRPESSK